MNWLLSAAHMLLHGAPSRVGAGFVARRIPVVVSFVLASLFIATGSALAQPANDVGDGVASEPATTPTALPAANPVSPAAQQPGTAQPAGTAPQQAVTTQPGGTATQPDADQSTSQAQTPIGMPWLQTYIAPHLPAPLSRLLDAGGGVAWLLFAISILMFSIILFKLVQFLASGLLSPVARRRANALVADFEAGRIDAPGVSNASGRDALGRVVGAAAHVLDDPALDDAARNAEVTRVASAEIARHRKQLSTLEVIASLAPMLGLLGTVLGMIEAFRAMEAAGDSVDPAVLSAGIWKALLTTAIGLVVAVPAILAHSALDRRIAGFAESIGDLYGRLATADARRSAAVKPTRVSADESGGTRPVAIVARQGQ